MNLNEAILNYHKYKDTNEMMHMIFATRPNHRFEPNSDAVVVELTLEEMEMNIADIAKSKCPRYDYFLEMHILQDIFEDIKKSTDYYSDEKKVLTVIHYAEFDA